MTKQMKILGMAAATALIIGGALWLYYSFRQTENMEQIPSSAGGLESQQQTGSPETLTSPSDVSDNAIDQDLRTIDAQLNGLEADVGSVDQSVEESQGTSPEESQSVKGSQSVQPGGLEVSPAE
ncbi:MAG: hypothetical protein WC397_02570 [Candidatus Paceibacterota bacterium]|jgi:hypothetical protein